MGWSCCGRRRTTTCGDDGVVADVGRLVVVVAVDHAVVVGAFF